MVRGCFVFCVAFMIGTCEARKMATITALIYNDTDTYQSNACPMPPLKFKSDNKYDVFFSQHTQHKWTSGTCYPLYDKNGNAIPDTYTKYPPMSDNYIPGEVQYEKYECDPKGQMTTITWRRFKSKSACERDSKDKAWMCKQGAQAHNCRKKGCGEGGEPCLCPCINPKHGWSRQFFIENRDINDEFRTCAVNIMPSRAFNC